MRYEREIDYRGKHRDLKEGKEAGEMMERRE